MFLGKVEQWLAYWAHAPKNVGSNPTFANFMRCENVV